MNNFSEIEHKYVLGKDEDKARLLKLVKSLRPKSKTKVNVTDHYYFLEHGARYVFRHRKDRELQQLTLKSLAEDNEERLEVNLDLDQGKGDQIERVRMFLGAFGAVWEGRIDKKVEAFYFKDCEVVYYSAKSSLKEVECFEIEAKNYKSKSEALKILSTYEKKLGLQAKNRCKENLFEMLLESPKPDGQQANRQKK